jgi:prepilin peptidase CpaA
MYPLMNTYTFELALAATAVGAYTDARRGQLPNWLVLPLIPAGFLLNFLANGVPGLMQSGIGLVVCGLIPLIMWMTSGGTAIGGGDVKLFAAIGALVGWYDGLEIQLTSYIALLVIAFFTLAWRGQLWKTLTNAGWMAINWLLPKAKRRAISSEAMVEMRLGPAIFLAALLLYALNTGALHLFGL